MTERSHILRAKQLRCSEQTPELNCSIQSSTLNLLTGNSEREQLLRVLGLLEKPFSGELLFEQLSTNQLSDPTRTKLRNQRFGFIFSDPFLLPSFSVVENVAMPLLKTFGTPAKQAREQTEASLGLVGIQGLAQQPAITLSAFDQMRVALARALAHRPAVLLLENPERNLRLEELLLFGELLRKPCKEWGAAIVMSSDSPELHSLADQSIHPGGHP